MLCLLESLGLWAMAFAFTFASKLAATSNEIFFCKKISQRIRIIYRFVWTLHYVLESPGFSISPLPFYSDSWQRKKCTRKKCIKLTLSLNVSLLS